MGPHCITRPKLGEILVNLGLCQCSDIHNACIAARINNQRLGSTLLKSGLIKEKDLIEALARQYNANPIFSIAGHELPSGTTNLLPLETALLHKAFIFDVSFNEICIASYDPANSIFFHFALQENTILRPIIVPYDVYLSAIMTSYQTSTSASTSTSHVSVTHNYTHFSKFPCVPRIVRNTVSRSLRKSSRTLVFRNGRFCLCNGIQNKPLEAIIDAAWLFGAIIISKNGAITICNETLPFFFNTQKLRRRIEDSLRKKISPQEVLQFALQLGIEIE